MSWHWTRPRAIVSTEAQPCPRCSEAMVAAERDVPPPPQIRVGAPRLPRQPLRLWRCSRCGAERPRWG
jgi:ribosomal protein S27AE